MVKRLYIYMVYGHASNNGNPYNPHSGSWIYDQTIPNMDITSQLLTMAHIMRI